MYLRPTELFDQRQDPVKVVVLVPEVRLTVAALAGLLPDVVDVVEDPTGVSGSSFVFFLQELHITRTDRMVMIVFMIPVL